MLAASLAGGLPAWAEVPALERTVADADRGVRAIITYDPYALTGGSEEVVNDDGTVSMLYWDGYVGRFSAQIIEGSLSGPDAAAFLREAVLAVCPSADAASLAREAVWAEGAFLVINEQCPAVDATLDD